MFQMENRLIHGRTTIHEDGIVLFWPGSGIEFNLCTKELWIEIESSYSIYEPWISVEVDGAWISRQILPRGRHWICILSGMDAKRYRNVRILKDGQPHREDGTHFLKLINIKMDGLQEKIQSPQMKLEFIGDSLTSGVGIIGAQCEESEPGMIFGSVNTYSRILAKKLGADYRQVSQSGWGVYSGWNNDRTTVLSSVYEQICGVCDNELYKELGALKKNNFEKWRPDYIIINLGTNDAAAFHHVPWTDTKGILHKQRLETDGTPSMEDIYKFEQAVIALIKQVRKCNLESDIIWAYGMAGSFLSQAISKAISNYQEKTADDRISFTELPDTSKEQMGAKRHPGAKAHQNAAIHLTEFIKKINKH